MNTKHLCWVDSSLAVNCASCDVLAAAAAAVFITLYIFISAKWTEWMMEILFSFDVCMCVCMSVYAQRTGQSDQFKTVKATNFKFHVHVSRDSPDMTP